MSAIIRRGDRVLIKPNLLSAAHPDRAVTTHPVVVEAVARLVLDAGGRVAIGDSPGAALKGLTRVHERTGMLDVSRRLGVPLVSFEAQRAVPRRIDGRTYLLARPVVDADVLLSVPKLKTHVLTLLTGAIKNCYGVQPGFAKGTFHTRYPRPSDFSEVACDVLTLAAPRMTIVDAVVCMEGNGPSSGRPISVGRIVAGPEPARVEAECARLVGVAPEALPLLRAMRRRGADVSHARVWYDGTNSAPAPPPVAIALPYYWAARHIPRAAAPLLRRLLWVHASVHASSCTRCGACVDACPTDAIEPCTVAGGAPRVNAAACVGCLTCREVCPRGAARMELSALARHVL
jgi:uncharacterized protein (DUF362 family)/ferredoxin